MKLCKKCGLTQPFDNFSPSKQHKDKLFPWCKGCKSEYQKSHQSNLGLEERQRRDALARAKRIEDPVKRERNLDYWKRYSMLKRYSITSEQFVKMLENQDGKCAICFRVPGQRAFSVDHDHSCCDGAFSCGSCVRGLLCNACNAGIGMLGDSPERVRSALAYLEMSAARPGVEPGSP